jgi:hypothetical protein
MARYMVGAPPASAIFHRKAAARTPAAPVFEDPLLRLLAAQQAEGWFKWENGFAGSRALAGSVLVRRRDGRATERS